MMQDALKAGNTLKATDQHGVHASPLSTAVAKKPKQGFSSLPSHEAYVIDVPEIVGLAAAFQYNYFAADEGTNETGGVPSRFLRRSGETFDAATVDLLSSRVPRQVNITFTPAFSAATRAFQRNKNEARSRKTGALIADNIDKIVSEDRFASQRFVSLTFQDAQLDDRVSELVSGSFVQHELDAPSAGSRDNAARFSATLGSKVQLGFLQAALGHSSNTEGLRFAQRQMPVQASVNASMQLNAKLVHDVIARGFKDPDGHFAADMHGLLIVSRRAQHQALLRFNPNVTEADYRSYVPYVELRFDVAADMPPAQTAEVVGYLVDRVETLVDGTQRRRDPIVIENPSVGNTVDLRVRYGAKYTYSVRTVARFVVPAIDDETGQVALATVLVSSRPSDAVVVFCREDRAPPPPADMGFTWDHATERMAVHWTFPTNPQRDIKRFQVFRRRTVSDPYQLVRMFDFDDSEVPLRQRERAMPHLIERVESPRMRYVDEEFTRTSRYIYALGSVDAHGNVSAYSAQHEVWFDQFRNKFMTRLVSHSGAPKQYPNMYLAADTFVDTIRDVGRSRLRVYFTPECYALKDAEGHVTPIVTTTKIDGGSYRLQFINPDAAKMAVAHIMIDDRRTSAEPGSNASLGN